MMNDLSKVKTPQYYEGEPVAPELDAWHSVFDIMCECGKHDISELELMEILNDRFVLKSK